jgi:hypothetical protein
MTDYGKGPSRAEWAQHEELQNTGAKGWNYIQRLPKVLKSAIPWLAEMKIAFVDEDDIEEFSYVGWRPMRSEHFGTKGLKNFNEVVGFRFNLSDVDGVIRYRKLILMLMPEDVRKRQLRKRNEAFENYYSKVTDEKEPYVHPLDERASEMKEYASAEREEGIVHNDPDMPKGQVRKETVG